MQVKLFGLEFDDVTTDLAVDKIIQDLGNNEKYIIVTPNVDHVVNLRKDQEMRDIFLGARYRFPDGMPIIWASRILFGRNGLTERVTGADLLPAICEKLAPLQRSIYLLGGNEGVAERAAAVLKARFPGLSVAGWYCPPFGFENDNDESQRIVRRINESQTDILFIGVGAPKQEKWASKFFDDLRVGPILGVGAAFDFVAGTQSRAPKMLQNVGLEWLWRLIHDPRRLWRRYLVNDAMFFWMLAKEVYMSMRQMV